MSWEGLAKRLEGRIVVLEPFVAEHERELFSVAQDPQIWRWMSYNAVESAETFHSWFDDALRATKAGDEAVFAVRSRKSGKTIGSTRYMTLRPEHRGLEIGWSWLVPSAWGTGANAEAKLLLLEHAFDRLGCIRVEFKTDARNERARLALEALPARFEGIFRSHMLVRGGERRNSAFYSVTDDDWPVVRTLLERRLSSKS
jgi:RimJ/RimL family protein N-acetyltransferase